MSCAVTSASVIECAAPIAFTSATAVYPLFPAIVDHNLDIVLYDALARFRLRFSPPGPPVTVVVSTLPAIVIVAAVPVPVYRIVNADGDWKYWCDHECEFRSRPALIHS